MKHKAAAGPHAADAIAAGSIAAASTAATSTAAASTAAASTAAASIAAEVGERLPAQFSGRRYLRLIEEQLAHLGALPGHGNRRVKLDHLVIAHLIAFFNPQVRGLRTIEDLFEDRPLRELFGLPRLPKSTVSDAQRVFDPALLLPLVNDLRKRAGLRLPQARRRIHAGPLLDDLTRRLIAVDGTFLSVAGRIAWAIFNRSGKGAVRLHVQFNVVEGLPDHVRLTHGQESEIRQLQQNLQPGQFYVMDRGFHDYTLLSRILEKDSDFLLRLRRSAQATRLEERCLSQADRDAGVCRDEVVELGWRGDQTPRLPKLRLVQVQFLDRHGRQQELRLLTNRMDLPAWMIAMIYAHRWQVELFFRWLKCVAHFNHFFSESMQGMTLQVYITLIGLLLTALETGAKPSKYDYALINAAVNGLIRMEAALTIAARRRAERDRAREMRKMRAARLSKNA